ncbi:MAG: HDOD domain-containing protein, partial [Burkholderiaceae bacterium]
MPTLIEPERPAPMPSPPPATPWGLLARRPLFDSRGALAGWDIELSAAARARATVTRVSAVRLSYGAALSAAATEVIADGRHALLAPPAELLVEAEFIASLPASSWLRLGPVELAALGTQAIPQIAAWRTRGLRVATPPGLVPGDLNLLDARGGAARLPATSGRGWVAINLGSLDALAASIASGCALCCGRFDAIPRPPRTARLADHAAGAARMLSALLAGGSARQLAEIAHTDVALSWRLLRLARSARFGRAAASLSAQQAIQLLGTRELYRWLSALMISARPDAPLAAGLQEQALARGRLLELLAARVGHAPPELLFIVGSFSLLEALLAVPLEVALVAVPLP